MKTTEHYHGKSHQSERDIPKKLNIIGILLIKSMPIAQFMLRAGILSPVYNNAMTFPLLTLYIQLLDNN